MLRGQWLEGGTFSADALWQIPCSAAGIGGDEGAGGPAGYTTKAVGTACNPARRHHGGMTGVLLQLRAAPADRCSGEAAPLGSRCLRTFGSRADQDAGSAEGIRTA
jgi:hypothetical protein